MQNFYHWQTAAGFRLEKARAVSASLLQRPETRLDLPLRRVRRRDIQVSNNYTLINLDKYQQVLCECLNMFFAFSVQRRKFSRILDSKKNTKKIIPLNYFLSGNKNLFINIVIQKISVSGKKNKEKVAFIFFLYYFLVRIKGNRTCNIYRKAKYNQSLQHTQRLHCKNERNDQTVSPISQIVLSVNVCFTVKREVPTIDPF